MIKPTTIMWLIILAFSVFGVFQVKYRVQDLHRDLTEINRQIEQERDAIHVLNAEWSYLNQPDRLRNIAMRHLDLRAVTIAQINPSLDTMLIASKNDSKNTVIDDDQDTTENSHIAQQAAVTSHAIAIKDTVKPAGVKKKPVLQTAMITRAIAPKNVLSLHKPLHKKQQQQPQPVDELAAIEHTLGMPRHIDNDATMHPILTSLREDQ